MDSLTLLLHIIWDYIPKWLKRILFLFWRFLRLVTYYILKWLKRIWRKICNGFDVLCNDILSKSYWVAIFRKKFLDRQNIGIRFTNFLRLGEKKAKDILYITQEGLINSVSSTYNKCLALINTKESNLIINHDDCHSIFIAVVDSIRKYKWFINYNIIKSKVWGYGSDSNMVGLLLPIYSREHIRSVYYWEKFRQSTTREEYRVGVYMLLYFTLFLMLYIYTGYYLSVINVGYKLSVFYSFIVLACLIPCILKRFFTIGSIIKHYFSLFYKIIIFFRNKLPSKFFFWISLVYTLPH